MHGAGLRRKMSPPCIKAVANMLPRRTLQNPKPYAQLVLGISSFHMKLLPAPAWQGMFRGDIVKQETNKSSVHIPADQKFGQGHARGLARDHAQTLILTLHITLTLNPNPGLSEKCSTSPFFSLRLRSMTAR